MTPLTLTAITTRSFVVASLASFSATAHSSFFILSVGSNHSNVLLARYTGVVIWASWTEFPSFRSPWFDSVPSIALPNTTTTFIL